MRKLLPVAALALLLPLAAEAQVRLGGKLGLGIPMGKVAEGGEDLSKLTSLAFPLELNASFAVAPNAWLGAYGGIALDSVGSTAQGVCDFNGTSCSQHTWRLGLKAEYDLSNADVGQFKPYLGANFGWEWNVTKQELLGDWLKETFSGWELGLEAGADAPLSPGFTAGVFVNLSFGEYGKYSYEAASGVNGSQTISSTAMHEWLTLGVRGNFDLAPAR